MNLNKLRVMSLGEVRHRLQAAGARKVRALLRARTREAMAPGRYLPKWRVNLSLFAEATARRQWERAEAALLQYMRARFLNAQEGAPSPRFFIDHCQKDEIVAVARRLPNIARDTQAADRLIEQRFSYLGIDADFSAGLDWRADPISRRLWPDKFYTEIKFYGQQDGGQKLPGDVKYVWELNRHHHFTVLGKAYWLTAEEKYASALLAQCESWIEQNPYCWGINWTSALEAGMRALSWLWAYFFCLQAGSMTPRLHADLLRMLQLHARYISRHLSFYTSPYNHLVGESTALFIIGLLLPEFPESARWREQGWKILLTEVAKQFHGDGMSVEQAIAYHHFTLGLYLQALILARRNGLAAPAHLRERLQRALEFSMHSMQPDGRHPMIGDNDNAFAFYFGEKPAWDFREHLALGAVLFQRGDFKFLAGDYHEACLWLLGPQSRRQFDQLAAQPPAQHTLLLKESGYAIVREGWRREAHYALFDCGPQSHGLFADENVSTAHGHPDALSFNLCVHGKPFLIDAGMLTYNGDLRWQNYFRSGAAHNTITLDGQSACKIVGRLGYARVHAVEQTAFINQDDLVFVEAQVTGFGGNFCHRRAFFYRPGAYWLIFDNLLGAGEHEIDRWFHFAPALTVQMMDGQILAHDAEAQGLLLRDLSNAPSRGEIFRGGEEPEQGWLAASYGSKIPAPVLRLRARCPLPAQFITLLLPCRGTIPALRHACSSSQGAGPDEPFVLRLRTEDWEDRIVWNQKGKNGKVSVLRKNH